MVMTIPLWLARYGGLDRVGQLDNSSYSCSVSEALPSIMSSEKRKVLYE